MTKRNENFNLRIRSEIKKLKKQSPLPIKAKPLNHLKINPMESISSMIDGLDVITKKLLIAVINNGPHLALASLIIFGVYFIIMTLYRLLGLCDLLFGHRWGL
ncbi:hypothetical protein ACFL5Z_17945 [Planctomycetota bacterium]